MKYQEKADNAEKVEIIILTPYVQQLAARRQRSSRTLRIMQMEIN